MRRPRTLRQRVLPVNLGLLLAGGKHPGETGVPTAISMLDSRAVVKQVYIASGFMVTTYVAGHLAAKWLFGSLPVRPPGN
jgi:hypothetical protein